MKTVFARKLVRYTAVVCLGAFALVGTACLPKGVTLQPTGGNACPAGTWHLSSEYVDGLMDTVFGSATLTTTITTLSDGMTLTITTGSTDTWSLAGNQVVHAVGSNAAGSTFDATGTADPSASGTETITGSKITFTLQSITGTVTVHGTVWGSELSRTYKLDQIGQLERLWGLNGTGSFTCSASGTLSLSLTEVQMNFKK